MGNIFFSLFIYEVIHPSSERSNAGFEFAGRSPVLQQHGSTRLARNKPHQHDLGKLWGSCHKGLPYLRWKHSKFVEFLVILSHCDLPLCFAMSLVRCAGGRGTARPGLEVECPIRHHGWLSAAYPKIFSNVIGVSCVCVMLGPRHCFRPSSDSIA